MIRRLRLSLILTALMFGGVTYFCLLDERELKSDLSPPAGEATEYTRLNPGDMGKPGLGGGSGNPAPRPEEYSNLLNHKTIGIRDRLAEYDTVAQKTESLTDRSAERIRLLQVSNGEAIVRVEERLQMDDSGGWMLISQVAMLADRILVTPTDERALEKLELIAAEEGYHLVRNSPYSALVKVVLPDVGLNSVPVSIELITSAGKGSLTAEPD